jgi:hypothetical protein
VGRGGPGRAGVGGRPEPWAAVPHPGALGLSEEDLAVQGVEIVDIALLALPASGQVRSNPNPNQLALPASGQWRPLKSKAANPNPSPGPNPNPNPN